MILLLLLFGLSSNCIFAVLVGLLGKKRRIGFSWAFFWSLLLTPFVGLIITLLSDRIRPEEETGYGCLGNIIIIIMFIVVVLLAASFLFGFVLV